MTFGRALRGGGAPGGGPGCQGRLEDGGVEGESACSARSSFAIVQQTGGKCKTYYLCCLLQLGMDSVRDPPQALSRGCKGTRGWIYHGWRRLPRLWRLGLGSGRTTSRSYGRRRRQWPSLLAHLCFVATGRKLPISAETCDLIALQGARLDWESLRESELAGCVRSRDRALALRISNSECEEGGRREEGDMLGM